MAPNFKSSKSTNFNVNKLQTCIIWKFCSSARLCGKIFMWRFFVLLRCCFYDQNSSLTPKDRTE
ncbi:unnamed protein product [Meloidogyne enterolobii]|uniref:Uncharacterized protein n=1 Tax=Meloidogyne enterolobii TaxID=390850 RepID=A0ACB0Z5R0_MELEN